MFTPFASGLKWPTGLFSRKSSSAINIPSVQVHEIETAVEKRARTLKHLLKLNHANHAILFHELRFHNHMPHLLGSAYLLGGDSGHLNDIYEEESKFLDPWKDSPGEIAKHDWKDFLGKRDYQRAFIDFFEDELVHHGYDWKAVVEEILFEGKAPLFNGLVAGLGHPLIHLGYAYEISSRGVAMEALGLGATSYNYLHKYLDDPSYSQRQAPYSSPSPLGIFEEIRADKTFDGVFQNPGPDNLEPLFNDYEDAVLGHWNAWKITDPVKQFEDSQKAAVALLVGSGGPPYDFFLVHLLTTSHAVRILIPFIPSQYHVPLVRQWWLIAVAIYIAQLRPRINLDIIKGYDLNGRDWTWTDKKAVSGKWSLDAHYVKAVRAMKEAANTWGDKDDFYLKAAVKFADEFGGWFGFAPGDIEAMEASRHKVND